MGEGTTTVEITVYTLDTNTVIYYLKDEAPVAELMDTLYRQNSPFYISAMTELELFSYAPLNDTEATRIDSFLRTVSIIPVDSRIARLAGNIRKIYGLKVADSAIAATALYTGSTLLTRNVRDF